jgi:cyclopropane fatty-acyl-phospholipid synthase-like methyltransferase
MNIEQSEFEKFKNLKFEDFRNLAVDDKLSVYQKIGFPDEYRKDKEQFIFQDITKKLHLEMDLTNKTIIDIGVGCSELAHFIIDHCEKQQHDLLLIDHKEMLDQLPDKNFIKKYYGYFPDDTEDILNNYQNKVDAIICYSIFHYVFYNTCCFKFLDVALTLLKPGGRLLIGDIPNLSKRKRFFASESGIAYHQNFTNTTTLPEIKHLVIEPTQMDDGVVFGILQRYRNFGFETYLLPQGSELPMANRREDILIIKN